MRLAPTIAAVRIRTIALGDREDLERFYASLSEDSLQARFLGAAAGIAPATARFFCGPDHEHREGIVAETVEPGRRRSIVGHLCLEPDRDGVFEMAIAVADDRRRQGIGRAMLVEAIAWARRRGVRGLSASMWSGNESVI